MLTIILIWDLAGDHDHDKCQTMVRDLFVVVTMTAMLMLTLLIMIIENNSDLDHCSFLHTLK